MTFHMEYREVFQHLGLFEQTDHDLGRVWRIGPLMANAGAARIGDRLDGFARLEQPCSRALPKQDARDDC